MIAEAMPQLVWTAKPDGTIDYLNRRWIEYTGVDLEELGRRDGEVGVIHPDEVKETWRLWCAALKSGKPYEREYRIRRASDGSYRWFLGRAVPIRAEDGAIVRWIGTATDIDERQRAGENLRFVVEAGNALSSSLEVEAICKQLARAAVEHFADWCFVTLARDGSFDAVAVEHKFPHLQHQIDRLRDRYPLDPESPLGQVVATNQPLLVERVTPEQIEAAARDEEHLRILNLLQMHSVMIVPLAAPDGRVYGALSLASSESRRVFTQTDLNVAKTVADRAALAIGNARVFENERRAAEQLRVAGRINQLLFESSDPWQAMERIARLIAVEVADACAILKLDGENVRTEIIVHQNPAIDDAIGAFRGRRTLRVKPESELASRLKRHETIVLAGKDSVHAEESTWPYLSAAVEALNAKASVIVPWYAGATTYGGLVAHYSAAFDPRDVRLLEEIARRASVALERAETLQRERKIATTLQQASLPSLIPRPEGLRFDAFYAPAGEEADVGGDWYDAIELDDGSVVVSVGDVTGRGIQAAAIMSKVRHAMGMASLHEKDPTKILDSAGWFLRKYYPDAIVTAFVGILSPDRRTMHFANAGHPLPLLRRGGEVIELQASGLPLGLRHLFPLNESQSVALRNGDVLLLFTDGLIETRREWQIGESRLREVVQSELFAASANPARLVARACMAEQCPDDVAILAISVGAAPAWTLYVDDARAAVDARSLFVDFLRGIESRGDFIDSAELVFGELLGNIVRHAPGPVEISVESREEALVLHVIDSGPPLRTSERRLPTDPLCERGRGLFIVTHVATDVHIDHVTNCGNHISVTMSRSFA